MEEGVCGLEEEEWSDGVYLEGLAPFFDRHSECGTIVIVDSCIGDYEVEMLDVVFGLEGFDGG